MRTDGRQIRTVHQLFLSHSLQTGSLSLQNSSADQNRKNPNRRLAGATVLSPGILHPGGDPFDRQSKRSFLDFGPVGTVEQVRLQQVQWVDVRIPPL